MRNELISQSENKVGECVNYMTALKKLENEFANPAAIFRGKTFWAWNGKLDESQLREQIRVFKAMGMGGFFMHSRTGLQTAYLSQEWFKMVNACIDEAQKNGIEAWLYDEDRYPSGAAGGLVTIDERYRIRDLVYTRYASKTFEWPQDMTKTYVFAVVLHGEKLVWYSKIYKENDVENIPSEAEIICFTVKISLPTPRFNNATYLDTLNSEAVAKFIEVTHEAYKEKFGKYFGKVVPGIFTDEPHCRSRFESTKVAAWTDKFPEKFQEMFGYDITEKLPELCFDQETGLLSQARYHYCLCKTEMFISAFSKQIGHWCSNNKLQHTGHVLDESPMSAQVSSVGSAMRFYRDMQIPGVDILTESRKEYITIKQCVSVARQTGQKWVLSELYGCTGWDTTFETYKHIGDWQAVLGITMRCIHLSLYSMEGEAKRDHPASIHYHCSWWKQYKFVEDYYSRLNVLLSEGEPVCDIAIIHPGESYYLLLKADDLIPSGNPCVKEKDDNYDNLVNWLLGGHLDFDFIDEHLLIELDGKVAHDENGTFLQVGKMKYRSILVPPMLTIRSSTIERLNEFVAVGGKVVFAGEVAGYVDAKLSDMAKRLSAGKEVSFGNKAIIDSLKDNRCVSICDQYNREISDILYQLRRSEDDFLFFMVNTSREIKYEQVKVSLELSGCCAGNLQIWDAATGNRFQLSGELTENSIDFNIDIPASGSCLIIVSRHRDHLPVLPLHTHKENLLEIGSSEWDFSLDDYNVLVLDFADCKVKVDGGEDILFLQTEILEIDHKLREFLKLEQRGGAMTQPWARIDNTKGPAMPIQLTYKFNVGLNSVLPVLLALEQPQRWQIMLNGNLVNIGNPLGHWVDNSIKTIPIDASLLRTGENVIVFHGIFDKHLDLESIYLLGDFGVSIKGKDRTITVLPDKLKMGSWVNQGLPFYSGNVTYRTQFELKFNSDMRYYLEFSDFSATAIEINCNGGNGIILGCPDYCTDITDYLQDGTNLIDIKLLGSRRNAFGPLHCIVGNPKYIAPHSFRHNSDNWQDDVALVDYGLYDSPLISISKQ